MQRSVSSLMTEGALDRPSIAGLTYLWAFEREALPFMCHARYWRRRWEAAAMPQSTVLKPVSRAPAWILYFIYAPAGQLDPVHHFTLSALSRGTLPVLAVVACATPDLVPAAVRHSCASVIWKALSGYDFSAYAIGLDAIAGDSAGADVLVFNDSVFGPFKDLSAFLDGAPWDLTGFVATDVSSQRHIQSYAFVMKDVTRDRLGAMGDILTTRFAFDDAFGTISCRELWMARQASYAMSVGSYWYGRDADVHDPTLTKAIELVDAGFPFIKRSLLSKQSRHQNPKAIVKCLERFGHPTPDLADATSKAEGASPAAHRTLLQRAGRRLSRVLKRSPP